MVYVLLAAIVGAAPPADVVVTADDARFSRPPAFSLAASPFALGGHYLAATARSSPGPAVIRVAAPEGEYFVYLSWMRLPRGAKDIVVRVGGTEVRIDQSRLANGRVPEDYPRDDMPQFQGLCSSGLFRLTSRPVRFGKQDAIEVVRSDTAAGTVTTLESVVFSPCLYLDDIGNDCTWIDKPTINLKDYGRALSGEIGFGLAFLMPGQPKAALEWTLPAAGPCLVSANVNRGPSRAESIRLEIKMPGGKSRTVALTGKSPEFGRGAWQDIGVLRSPGGVKLRLSATPSGCACVDLLRLTPLREADLAGPGEKRWDTFVVQWEAATAQRPWLESLKVVPGDAGAVESSPMKASGGLAHGLRARIARRSIAVLDAGNGSTYPSAGDASFRIELAHEYGVTLSTGLLRREGFVWLKDLGIFASADGDFASRRPEIDAQARQVEAARREPFRSTAEKYRAATGYDEARPGQDDRAFRFAYDPARPLGPRVAESIAAMPEVDYPYFLQRIDEPKHRRMFLGWPNVCQEFYVLSNGAIGVSSGSGAGTGHPPAEHFAVQFGVGEKPQFKEHGDPSVTQKIEDGYHIIVHTKWHSGDAGLASVALAYPLAGEEVRTGNEPLAALVRLARFGKDKPPLWLKIRPDQWGGPHKPLTGLAGARIESTSLATRASSGAPVPCGAGVSPAPQSRVGGAGSALLLTAGGRTVLGLDAAKASIAAASDQEVLVKIDLEPVQEHVDLVLPYIAVDKSLVANAMAVGFGEIESRTKRYWDRLLAAGATIDTPDPVVNNLYKTLLARTLVTADLDTQGDYALKTSPIIYDAVWLHATAYGIEGLARRGHFRQARQYLEAAFRWQGSQSSDAKTYTTWKGFFNAPPRYTALLWINFHGWMQWAAARYFRFSGDLPWLKEKLPALIDSLEWTTSQRRLTMRGDPGGDRPDNYGWLPPGRVTDGSAGTSTFTDCINWMGFNELTTLLERIGHPRAREFRAVADDYRDSILRGLRRAAGRREPVRVADGSYVPYVPGYLESAGHEETMWYAAVVDGGLEGIVDSGIMPPGEPIEDWVLGNLEDNLFVIAPNLADEAYFLGHGCAYLRRDRPELAIYTFYSVIASHMSRQTLTTFEHRSWGANRVYDLAPWPLGYYTRMLAGMLAWDESEDELVYCRATPRAWLDPGKRIRVERLQTRFGPTSFTLDGKHDKIEGVLELPRCLPPKSVKIKLRANAAITSVHVNDRPVPFDAATGTVILPASAGPVRVAAKIDRR